MKISPIARRLPGGRPASWNISASLSAVMHVFDAGLSTAQFPMASAGASFHASIEQGKIPGDHLAHHTPSGAAFRPGATYSSLSAHPPW